MNIKLKKAKLSIPKVWEKLESSLALTQIPHLDQSKEERAKADANEASLVRMVEIYQKTTRSYTHRAQTHLYALKNELYKTLDINYPDASLYNFQNSNSSIFNDKLSVFFEKAYTIQHFTKEGKPLVNREQTYIDAGKKIEDYYTDTKPTLTEDQSIVYDAGLLISAINGALSMANRVEASYNKVASLKNEIKSQTKQLNKSINSEEKKQVTLELQKKYDSLENELKYTAGHIHTLVEYVTNLIELTSKSKIIDVIDEKNSISTILNSLIDLIIEMKNFIIALGKPKNEQYKVNFFTIKQKYVISENKQAEENEDDMISKTSNPALSK